MSWNDYQSIEALKYASENNIIDFADILSKFEVMKNQYYLSKHTYSIWEGSNDKKWYTYLPDKAMKRDKKLVKRTSKEAIEKVIIEYWKNQEEYKNINTFKDAYFFWREKHDVLVDDNSIAKYNSDYKRFFKNQSFENMNLKSIMDDDIKLFMVQTIKSKNLQRETARKLLRYIINTFTTARKYKIIFENPAEFIEPNEFYKYCTQKEKTNEDNIMTLEEQKILWEQIQKDHAKNPAYMPSYAVELAMLTGMRVAELSALRWNKITDQYIIIDSSEKTNPTKTEFHIGNTKNGKTRYFPIDAEIQKLLDTIKTIQEQYGIISDWVFADKDGNRIHGKTISACIKTKCRQTGIKGRGIYALRKTFNSAMRCSGVSSVVAAELLGHSPETNNKYYTFDNTDLNQKNKIVSQANARILGFTG